MTCTAVGGVHFKNWIFSDGSYEVARGAAIDSPTWTGMLVQTGHVTVDIYNSAGGVKTVSVNIAPVPRPVSLFSLSATAPVQQNVGYVCNDGVDAPISLSLPSPPNTAGSGDGVEGKFCELPAFSYSWVQVGDSGPNQAYYYVASVTSNTQFFWVESVDLTNTSSEFFKAQCGNYNATTNAQGFISGSQLAMNTIHHESGSSTSHYANWVSALANNAYNPGTALESAVYLAASANQFQSYVGQVTANSIAQIGNTAASKPCPAGDLVNLDASCVYDGGINYLGTGTSYAPCN